MGHLLCSDNYFSVPHYLKALIGLNIGLASIRFMQVESVGDYFGCDDDKPIDTPEALFRLLIDNNMCDKPVIRVDITTDDGACTDFHTCNNGEQDWFTDLKGAIGKGDDGAPILRIMLSSGLS